MGPDEFRRVLNAAVGLTAGVAIFSYVAKFDFARGYAVVALLRRDSYHGLTVVAACVAGARHQGEVADVPVCGGLDSVASVVTRFDADTVAVLACPEMNGARLRELAWDLEKTGTEMCVASALLDVAGPRTTIRPVAGLPLLHVDHAELTGSKQVIKGVFDKVSAGVALIVLAPLFMVVAFAIAVSDHGPVFFRQTRIGRDGQTFRVWKFRTMVVDAESRKAQLLARNDADGALFKMRADPRVTRAGGWLRRWSLDELPQLLNVLAGDMSLVGPRQALPVEVARIPGSHAAPARGQARHHRLVADQRAIRPALGRSGAAGRALRGKLVPRPGPADPVGQAGQGRADGLIALVGEQALIGLGLVRGDIVERGIIGNRHDLFARRQAAQALVPRGGRQPGAHPGGLLEPVDVLQQAQPGHLGNVSGVAFCQLEVAGHRPDQPGVLVNQPFPHPPVPRSGAPHQSRRPGHRCLVPFVDCSGSGVGGSSCAVGGGRGRCGLWRRRRRWAIFHEMPRHHPQRSRVLTEIVLAAHGAGEHAQAGFAGAGGSGAQHPPPGHAAPACVWWPGSLMAVVLPPKPDSCPFMPRSCGYRHVRLRTVSGKGTGLRRLQPRAAGRCRPCARPRAWEMHAETNHPPGIGRREAWPGATTPEPRPHSLTVTGQVPEIVVV